MAEKTKLLIVEDDTPLVMMMVHMLSHAGCDVVVAATGKEGMELAQESEFDLILLEIDLPDITGLEICGELKQRHLSRHTPVVFVSDHTTIEDQQHGLDVGAADYITKPFDPSNFVSRILSHATGRKDSNLTGTVSESSMA
ncbi:MAG: response regulator [Verrucomicrobiota bacterium]|jgi:putative two-component system response regulator